MITGDAAYIKKLNRSLILSQIIEYNKISRADLSKVTGLNKATISVQVSDLLEEQLLIEEQYEHNNLGRRPILLSLNRKAGYALGIDLDKDQILFTLSDLLGFPTHIEIVPLQTKDYNEIVDILVEYIIEIKKKCQGSTFGLIGVTVGIHGLVSKDEKILFFPHLKWRNKNIKSDLVNKADVTVFIENNANLTAFAENVFKHNKSSNLISISMHSGIGLGMMMNGEIHKGFHGYAGEIGHMIVVPDGNNCACGNQGCWELYASESSFFKQLEENYQRTNADYYDIHTWLKMGKPDVVEQMEQLIKYISIGLNNIINMYNPEIIVLNSELLRLSPNAITQIERRLNSNINHYSKLLISELGKQACVMGACALSIKKFLQISELNLQITMNRTL
ncbi:ROK family protein [Lederbergia wuyishanensis]|uniref:NBD/HSP70 family sugar kinase n=1 Tax=Lederbergia wuyishanensis TaxID=1347903 RepID=A0ABU0D3X6_9BACI|nr:ROK family protein [Lederbergia wuyishanensis]MCJ8007737.1 ROK family protein [Lederbergia wuyishanensis]MDQ0343100.1 putative NBD/HSP70 family sugar kinase [Lederbergia wuyishanensis]